MESETYMFIKRPKTQKNLDIELTIEDILPTSHTEEDVNLLSTIFDETKISRYNHIFETKEMVVNKEIIATNDTLSNNFKDSFTPEELDKYSGYDISSLELINNLLENPSYSEAREIFNLEYNETQDVIIDNILNNKYSVNDSLLYSYVVFRIQLNSPKFYKQLKEQLIKKIIENIRVCTSKNNKGLYLKYGDESVMLELCRFFYINRFNIENYFIIQLLNDANLYPENPNEMKTHFIRWYNNTPDYFKRSNILDILLQHSEDDPLVQEIYQIERLRGNMMNATSNNLTIYNDTQNVHNSTIMHCTKEKAKDLIKFTQSFENVDIIKFLTENNIFDDITDNVIHRIFMDNTRFNDSFTAYSLFTSVIKYINKSEHKSELIIRLKQEINEMDKLCISGHITRIINVFKGFDERFEVNMNFADQLKSVIKTLLSKEINKLEDSELHNMIVYGTYDENFKKYYYDFIKNILNKNLVYLCDEYGKEDVITNICEVTINICDKKIWWTFNEDNTQLYYFLIE